MENPKSYYPRDEKKGSRLSEQIDIGSHWKYASEANIDVLDRKDFFIQIHSRLYNCRERLSPNSDAVYAKLKTRNVESKSMREPRDTQRSSREH